MAERRAGKKKGGIFRENIEALAVAIVMAVVIKQFAFEAFKVPTESMEPTIIGRRQGGDRIIVNKFVYQIRDPRRFEVMVFKYPLNLAVNYVKRVVGMPGEHIEIIDGDIFTRHAGAAALGVVRKPDVVQDVLFRQFPLIPADVASRPGQAFRRGWLIERDTTPDGRPNPKNWQAAGDDLRGIGAAEASWVSFRRQDEPVQQRDGTRPGGLSTALPDIHNRRTDPDAGTAGGKAPGTEEASEVGDVRATLVVTPDDATATLLVRLDDAYHATPIRLALAGTGAAEGSVLSCPADEGPVDHPLEVRLTRGRETEVRLANVDDTVILHVDGDEAARITYAHPRTPKKPSRSAIHIGVRGGTIRFSSTALERDVYYTVFGLEPETTVFDLGPEDYLCLGDNSANSLDARGWRFADIRLAATGEVLRGDREGVTDDESAPRHESNPWLEPDGRVRFCDILGNIRTLEVLDLPPAARDGRVEPVNEAGPGGARFTGRFRAGGVELVPSSFTMATPEDDFDHVVRRWQVVGRALTAFWPLSRIGLIR